MTDKPNKYKNFVVYKIYCLKDEIRDCYVGSTVNFSRRKSQHKKNTTNKTKKSYWRQLYRFIRDNGGWDHFKIEIIERYPCENDLEAKMKEQYYIDKLNPSLNKNKCIVDMRLYNVKSILHSA